MTIYWWK